MFKKQDHTQVAGALASDALSMFNDVRVALDEANAVLEAGIGADALEHKRLADRLDQAAKMHDQNSSVAKKIEALFS